MALLQAINLVKTYCMGQTKVKALNDVSFSIDKGEFVAITGTSGSGKSTLMHLLGCLDIPTSGQYLIEDKNVAKMTKNELARIRNQKIGFVFQKFHLLPDLTATDNVALPGLYAGDTEKDARQKANSLLELVGLQERADHFPYQLSGGQQQRVAIARSLINNPAIILADEPTGNLDSNTGNTILELFKTLNTKNQMTIIIVTHEHEIAHQTKRILELVDGKIKSDKTI